MSKQVFLESKISKCSLVRNYFSGAGRLLQRARDTETMYFQVVTINALELKILLNAKLINLAYLVFVGNLVWLK